MSLPAFSTQAELFSTAGLSASLFAPTDRYRLFAKLVYPKLASSRPSLEKCYCADNGRVAIEPVLMMGVSLLQEIDGVPDRQAVEMLRYHAGWNFALNRQLGDAGFHPTSLVNFRHRLNEHAQDNLAFKTVLEALQEAQLVSRHCRQRLDSTQILGRVAKMNRLDCVRESLRMALEELAEVTPAEQRPVFWNGHWERYVESQVDFRSSAETLGRKLGEAGADAWQLLEWAGSAQHKAKAAGPQLQLLKRVFGEQFEVRAGQAAPKENEPVTCSPTTSPSTDEVTAEEAEEPAVAATPAIGPATTSVPAAPVGPSEATGQASVVIEPKGKGQFESNRVQNPHDPDATYAVKGQGQQKKEHVGYKVQVAESVSEITLAPGEPTRNFITGIVVHPAYESDELGAQKMEQDQASMGMDKPPVHYVDGAYVSARQLAQVASEGRELIGPAQPAPAMDGRFTTEEFRIDIPARTAVCPVGQTNLQCSRLEEQSSGKVTYRFEFGSHCHDCPLRGRCLGKDQKHRTITVGEYHDFLQARRQEQQTPAFQLRMKHRNGIEGTQSELVRGHGLRRAKYRGLAKVQLQSYFIGAACNAKRWIRREAWAIGRALAAAAAQLAAAPVY